MEGAKAVFQEIALQLVALQPWIRPLQELQEMRDHRIRCLGPDSVLPQLGEVMLIGARVQYQVTISQ